MISDIVNVQCQDNITADVSLVAQNIAAIYGDAVVGIFFYGSCLHTGNLTDKVLDFYVVVDQYRKAYDSLWLRVANRVCPPNAFYHEMENDGQLLRSKYAVISQKDFVRRCGSGGLNSSIWARFCQPTNLILARDDESRALLLKAVEVAVETAVHAILPLFTYAPSSMELWGEVFRRTYGAELRSEREQKALEIYILDQERYDAITRISYSKVGLDPDLPLDKQPARLPMMKANIHWWLRKVNGKTVSFLRLVKSSFTFDGGIDYIAWKMKRHSGVEFVIKPWMRRHPLIAGLVFFWHMKRRDAFR